MSALATDHQRAERVLCSPVVALTADRRKRWRGRRSLTIPSIRDENAIVRVLIAMNLGRTVARDVGATLSLGVSERHDHFYTMTRSEVAGGVSHLRLSFSNTTRNATTQRLTNVSWHGFLNSMQRNANLVFTFGIVGTKIATPDLQYQPRVLLARRVGDLPHRAGIRFAGHAEGHIAAQDCRRCQPARALATANTRSAQRACA